ncbi:molybdopterin-synthase adenylyltransferase MoeB [Thermodesulfobacteriota bacterium]
MFTEEDILRYSRHILLPEVGVPGQKKIQEAKIFILGAGGLGSPALLYLAAAGVKEIGVADADTVDLSNLQRQVLHFTDDVDKLKTESAKEKLNNLNPGVKITAYSERVTKDNVMDIFSGYDIILDGSDNFPTRYLLNDACYFLKKVLVSGSILRFDGQLTVFDTANGSACYRCLYPEPPPKGMVPSCQEAGVLGVVAGTIGVLQAQEALKVAIGIGEPLTNQLLIFDALNTTFKKLKVRKDPHCPLCSDKATIKELVQYVEEEACELR